VKSIVRNEDQYPSEPPRGVAVPGSGCNAALLAGVERADDPPPAVANETIEPDRTPMAATSAVATHVNRLPRPRIDPRAPAVPPARRLTQLMAMASQASNDLHWERVVEIASKLWIDGHYVVQLDPSPTQRFVDLQWAAHQAGRVLGGRARIETSRARETEDPTITVTVRYVDPDGKGLQRAEEGLEKLLRQVLADHFRRDH
jgi:hypothetical protein